MKKTYTLKSRIFLGLTLASLFGGTALADQVEVQILGVNDFHGALSTTGSAYMENNQRIANAGTAAQLAAHLNKAEADFLAGKPNGKSIRVQAGDMVGASPANSGLLQDEPTIKVFNQMGFDYGTIGNHEFDEGLAEFNRILTGQAPQVGLFNPVVDQYPHEASTQKIVVSNVVDAAGQLPFDNWVPYAIEEVKVGDKVEKIGFIGVVTTEIPDLVLKKHYENYQFLDEAETIAKYSKTLSDQGVNAIVVLAHVPSTSVNNQATGEMADIMTQVNQLNPSNSVDVVFAGHNHVYTNGIVGTTRIVQATSQGKAYANVIGTLDTETHDFTTVPEATISAVDPNNGLTPDANVAATVADADARITTVTAAKIGTATPAQTITRDVDENKESPVGRLITTAQLEMAKKAGYNVDFAMTNNGGIRADLDVQADGTITWGAAQKVQPFGNILQIVEMTGQDVINVLNQQYDQDEKYFLQISGLNYIYTDAQNPVTGQKYEVYKAYTPDGKELDLQATYKVVINDFLFGGGDGFSGFTTATLSGAIDADTETFVNYIKGLESTGQSVTVSTTKVKTYKTAEEIQALNQPTPTVTTTAANTTTTSTVTTTPPTTTQVQNPKTETKAKAVYRLYHPGIRAHLYTTDANEYKVLGKRGWKQEGIAWKSSNTGAPVYRLYHAGLKVHLYTKDANEYKVLANRGWKQEGVAYHSEGDVKVYRLYHSGLKKHLYTKDNNEYKVLGKRGWRQEGLAWYAK